MSSSTELSFPIPRDHPLDPPPAYREIRADRPISRVVMPDGQQVWLITRHDHCRKVLTDRRFSSDPTTPGYPSYISGDTPLPDGFFLNQDPPDHTRLRSLVTRQFVISEMERLRPRMQSLVDRLIEDLIQGGTTADLVTQLALPMAAGVICDLLDVPYDDHRIFVRLTDIILDRSSEPAQVGEAATELMAYFSQLVSIRIENPGADILSTLVGPYEQEAISYDEFVGLAALLMLSGYDTMAQMIGLGTLALFDHPDQQAELKSEPRLYPKAVEELLRFLSINHSGLPRAATERVEIDGCEIEEGEGLLVLINAANRDPEAFVEPDRLDIHRDSRHHVAFGHGLHKCVGLALARVELEVVFRSLFARLPNLHLAVPIDDLTFRHEMVLYGVRHLPIEWDEPERAS